MKGATSSRVTNIGILNEAKNGASGTSDMDGYAARVAARESGDEQVQSLIESNHDERLNRDVSLRST